jgi:hypothetical protein
MGKQLGVFLECRQPSVELTDPAAGDPFDPVQVDDLWIDGFRSRDVLESFG